MSGHGHVIPNKDGSKARCGGPRICQQCAYEAVDHQAGRIAALEAENAQLRALVDKADAIIMALGHISTEPLTEEDIAHGQAVEVRE